MTERKFNDNFIAFTAILLWVAYSCIYTALKKNENTAIIAGWLTFIGEVVPDVIAATLAFLLFKKIKDLQEKKVFFIFFISLMAITFQDFVYTVSVNLLNLQYDSAIILSFLHPTMIIFLLGQLIAWSWILFTNRIITERNNKWIYVPSVMVAALIFSMFMLGIPWKVGYFSVIGLPQIIETILEAVGFPLAAICLIRSSTQLIRFLSAGYLLIISADFIIRFSVIEGVIPYLDSVIVIWMLGSWLICLGFLFFCGDKEKLIKLSPSNSIQSQIAMWMLSLWLLSAFLFVGTYAIFSGDNHYGIAQMSKNLLSMIIPFSVLAIISSSYISKKISSPLAKR